MSQKIARRVLRIEATAIFDLIPRINDSFDEAVGLLLDCKGRVVTTGMGKSGIVCRKIAATLSSTGTPAVFVHPAEARHGDVGMLAAGDVVLLVSNSGETEELIQLLGTIKRLGLPLISMIGSEGSTIARDSDLVLDISVDQEACPFGLAPTASTTAALALGDALAIALSEKKGFRLEEFAQLHPGGKLGKKLARVGDLMHAGGQVPKVIAETGMEEVIYEMSRKGLGITAVVRGDDLLVGVISDGDLRRLLQVKQAQFLNLNAEECMTPSPITIGQDELATRALNILEENKITSLMVTDSEGRLVGVIHLHDLWGTEMF
jgi:arabinose-5-phosphate isomerase